MNTSIERNGWGLCWLRILLLVTLNYFLLCSWMSWGVHLQIMLCGGRHPVFYNHLWWWNSSTWTGERICPAPCAQESHSSRPGVTGQVCYSAGRSLLNSRGLWACEFSAVRWLWYIHGGDATDTPSQPLVCWKGSTEDIDHPQSIPHSRWQWCFSFCEIF